METESETKKITRDMVISEILMEHPKQAMLLSEIMMEFGIHCVGCGAASFETLEQGVLGHGFSEEQLNELVSQLNKAVENKEEATPVDIDFNITLTDSAVKKIKEAMKQKDNTDNLILRISVLAGGCSGFMYGLEIIEEPIDSDLNLKHGDLNLAVDKRSIEYLNGTEIDFIDTLNDSGFKFNNPNAERSCGCGKSFH
jgi:iron-sulfur cluster assembly accessory protein